MKRTLAVLSACVFAITAITAPCAVIAVENEPQPMANAGILVEILDFLEEYGSDMGSVAFSMQRAIEEGRLDPNSEEYKKVQRQFGLASLFGMSMQHAYIKYLQNDAPWSDAPPTTTIGSISAVNGLYKHNGVLHPVNIYPPLSFDGQSCIVESDEYKVYVTISEAKGFESDAHGGYAVTNGGEIRVTSTGYMRGYQFDFSSVGGEFNPPSAVRPVSNSEWSYVISGNAPLDLDSQAWQMISGLANGYNSYIKFGGYPVEISMDGFDFDTEAPWDYYNQEMIPKLKELSPDTEYYPFPDGYHPAPLPTQPPDPTEPTNAWDGVAQPETEVIYPTDEDGEPLTDENGETETETVFVTDTTPTDLKWDFNVPKLPTLPTPEIPDLNPELPEQSLKTVGTVFDYMGELLEASGLMGILPFVLGLLAAMWLIYRLGG